MDADIILIADQSRARIFFRETPESPFIEHADFINAYEHQREDEILTDGPGTPSTPMGIYGRPMPAENTAYRHGWELFARTLMQALEDELRLRRHARVHLIAPPRFLGVLRSKLTRQVSHHLGVEVNHNLTMLKTPLLQASLPGYLERGRIH